MKHPSTCSRRAFTLAEVLVSMGIFVTLMAIASGAFASFSKAGERALSGLDLQTKASSLHAIMRESLADITPMAGMRLMPDGSGLRLPPVPGLDDRLGPEQVLPEWSFIAMRAGAHDYDLAAVRAMRQEGRIQGGDNSYLDYHGSDGNYNCESDLSWCLLDYRRGRLYRALSPRSLAGFADVIYSDDGGKAYEGMPPGYVGDDRDHDITTISSYRLPQLQQDIDFILGAESATGDQPGARIALQNANWSAPEPLRTTLEMVWKDAIIGEGGNNAYGASNDTLQGGLDRAMVVRNADGRSWNRDLLNLVGSRNTVNANVSDPESDDKTEMDIQAFLDRRQLLISGVAALSLELVGGSGDDITGLAVNSRSDMGGSRGDYPDAIRYSGVVHLVPSTLPDDWNVDGNDGTTLLVEALNAAASPAQAMEYLDAAGEEGLLVRGSVPIGSHAW
ncbi:MAG: PulJ/GspJ family protein [Planctomycetota bacterium]